MVIHNIYTRLDKLYLVSYLYLGVGKGGSNFSLPIPFNLSLRPFVVNPRVWVFSITKYYAMLSSFVLLLPLPATLRIQLPANFPPLSRSTVLWTWGHWYLACSTRTLADIILGHLQEGAFSNVSVFKRLSFHQKQQKFFVNVIVFRLSFTQKQQ